MYGLGSLLAWLLPFGWATRLTVAALALLAFLLLDSGVLTVGTPMWRRQTPLSLFYRFGPVKGALLWGLDTGLMFTTYRVTSLTWATWTLALVHLLPWWGGTVYAAGFLLPSAVAITVVPWRDGIGDRVEPNWLLDRLGFLDPLMRRIAPVTFVAAAADCLAALFLE
jgi:hypothetical protein